MEGYEERRAILQLRCTIRLGLVYPTASQHLAEFHVACREPNMSVRTKP